MELLKRQGRRSRTPALAIAAGTAGLCLGLVVNHDLAPLAILAAVIAGMSFAASR